MDFLYKFPAVKGIQAGNEYYVTMVPLKLLSKIFGTSDEFVPPEFRAQRLLNESRIPEICSYILNNKNSYVFSALSASIDGDISFISSKDSPNIGILEIPMSASFLINDGQHRKSAIERALKLDDSIKDETISIVFFKDCGLSRSQQMFTDLNKHAVKTSNSIATLYDSRDQLAVATKNIINKIPFFRRYVDKEKDNLGKNSGNLFTLNNVYKANQKIVKNNFCKTDENFILKFWTNISSNINEWNEVMSHQLTKKDLRENYIVTLAITLQAFGKLGNYFYTNKKVDMSIYLQKLKNIDWTRNNDDWRNKPIATNGKVLNNDDAMTLLYLTIKQRLGLPLENEEKRKLNGKKIYGK